MAHSTEGYRMLMHTILSSEAIQRALAFLVLCFSA